VSPTRKRRTAPKRAVRATPNSASAKRGADAERLLHELEVHQIELEAQNQELMDARGATEHALERYTQLFDFAPIGYAALSPDGTIRELNHAGARLLGADRSLLVGEPLGMFVAVADRKTLARLIARVLASQTSESTELALLTTDGRSAVVRVTASMLVRAEPAIFVALEDITERKRKAAELARVHVALVEQDRRKDEFLATLSHELRNPLSPIRTGVFVLGRTPADSPRFAETLAIIDRQVAHMTRLIDDLLDVTRITRGKLELQREHVELGPLVVRAIVDHRESFDAAGIDLDVLLPDAPTWIDADPARVTQIVSNLLGNALKFTPHGGHVGVAIELAGDELVLRVVDDGAGIPRELIARVFELFVQAPQTIARSRGGLGLGLAMVKGLVELHGGRVAIASDGIGCGTAVTLALPRAEPPPARVADERAELASVRCRILVVDDQVDMARSLAQALTLAGHDVEVAFDGLEGVERARAFRPDVVLCDLGMPQLDGYGVARALRADPELRCVRLVALSGYTQPEDRARSAEAGFDAHIAKPVSLDQILRAIAAPA
jgi:two-component system CheB/CheR fusion protein